MKTSEETLDWLVETIWHIYDHPAMYAFTLGELDGVLYTHHFLWGFISERVDWITAHGELCKGKYTRLLHNEIERNHVVENRLDPESFKLILDHWKSVDARIGLSPPKSTNSN